MSPNTNLFFVVNLFIKRIPSGTTDVSNECSQGNKMRNSFCRAAKGELWKPNREINASPNNTLFKHIIRKASDQGMM